MITIINIITAIIFTIINNIIIITSELTNNTKLSYIKTKISMSKASIASHCSSSCFCLLMV